MSTLAGHSADYDREISHVLSDEDVARRRVQLERLRAQATLQVRKQLAALAESARCLHAAGNYADLQGVNLKIAQVSSASSASYLRACCSALAIEIRSAGERPWYALLVEPPRLKRLRVPLSLMLDECARLVAEEPSPSKELVKYVKQHSQAGSSNQHATESDA